MKKAYFEIIEEGSREIGIIRSSFRPATEQELTDGQKAFKEGKCKHNLFYDEPGYMYDFRHCFFCNGLLGMI